MKWFKETAGNFPSVETESMDWVFSGQNIEHLWFEDFLGFFIEANRVLKFGGILSLDTPNRDITSRIGWNHPQHFAEFSCNEIVELLELAGFQVNSEIGIFPTNFNKIQPNKMLNLNEHGSNWRYFKNARKNPRGSFIFWINATKMQSPNLDLLKARAAQIFYIALLSRVNRFQDGRWNTLKKSGILETEFDNESIFPFRLCLPIWRNVESLTVNFNSAEDLEFLNLRVTLNDKQAELIRTSQNTWSAKIEFPGVTSFNQVIKVERTGILSTTSMGVGIELDPKFSNEFTDLFGFKIK